MGLGVALGLAIAAIGVLLAEPVLQLMGTEAAVADEGGAYLRAVMASTPLMVVMLIGNGSLRGAGDTRTPMLISAVANVANVLAAYPLIFGVAGLPALGVVGAAWGIAAARIIGCVLVGRALLDGQGGLGLAFIRRWRPDRQVLRLLLTIGGPAAAESGSIQVGMMIFSLIVISLGTAAFAAQQIVFNAANLSMMPGMAFSVAATTLVGQALGAGQPGEAERAGWRGAASAAVWMSLMGAVFVLFPEQIVGLYTSDPEVVRHGATGLRIVGFGQPLQGIAFALSGALRGAGDTRTTLKVGGASVWLARLPVAYGLGILAGLGVTGVWLAWVGDWTIRGALYARAFRRGAWKKLRI
jgi:putative MATE family efflux protein